MDNNSFDTVRVASYNLLHKPHNLTVRLNSLKNELLKAEPDVIGFQETFDGGWNELKELMHTLGYIHHFKSLNTEIIYPDRTVNTGNAIFSKFPLANPLPLKFPLVEESIPVSRIPDALATEILLPDGKHFQFITHHGVWLALNEKQRYQQAMRLNKFADEYVNKGLFTVMVGDFNATENGQTMKYLTGETPDTKGEFAYWVDAYKLKGSPEDHTTSSPELFWARHTAKETGIIFPEHLPNRRIDYILVHGWVYGRNGCPTSFGRLGVNIPGDANPSDHYGIYSDILYV